MRPVGRVGNFFTLVLPFSFTVGDKKILRKHQLYNQ